jgi:hypothetical protein
MPEQRRKGLASVALLPDGVWTAVLSASPRAYGHDVGPRYFVLALSVNCHCCCRSDPAVEQQMTVARARVAFEPKSTGQLAAGD